MQTSRQISRSSPITRRVTAALIVASAAVVVVGVTSAFIRGQTSASPAPTTTPASASGAPQDWTQARFDLAGTGVNPEGLVTSANVAQVTQAWQSNGLGTFISTPAVADGIVYANTDRALIAFDLASGRVEWQHADVASSTGGNSSAVSVDTLHHRAYYATGDTRVYAVDTRDGAQVWTVQLGDPAQGAHIWGSPLLANNLLYIGMASNQDEPCVRGAVYALDPATGAIAWTHYTEPADRLGGSVWSPLAADVAEHAIIATTSNPCPEGATHAEEDAFIALDWTTGQLRWSYSVLSDDNCDCDFSSSPVIYTTAGRTYAVAGNKYGQVYAMSPSADGTSARLAWTARIAGAGQLGVGGVFEPPAYANGIVYIAGGPTLDGVCPHGALWALDARIGARIWRVCTTSQVPSGAAISGDLIFVAQAGELVAYQLATGAVAWSEPLQGAPLGGIALADGNILVGTPGGTLYCFHLPTQS